MEFAHLDARGIIKHSTKVRIAQDRIGTCTSPSSSMKKASSTSARSMRSISEGGSGFGVAIVRATMPRLSGKNPRKPW